MFDWGSSDDTDDDWHKQGRFDGHSIGSDLTRRGSATGDSETTQNEPRQRPWFSVNGSIPPGIDRFPGSLLCALPAGRRGPR